MSETSPRLPDACASGRMPAPLRIGPLEVATPVELAPMAGVTNASFRRLCREMAEAALPESLRPSCPGPLPTPDGGLLAPAGLYVTEMVTTRALVERNERTLAMVRTDPAERVRSIQLYGVDPATVGAAVRILVEEDLADHIDLNFGCPVPKVTRKGGGAALPWKRDLLAAILAAIMSTISSQLLVSSSALVEDLYHAFNRRELGEKRSVLLGRVAVMLVSVVAAIMAWQANDSILNLVSFAWAGFGASFGPVVLLALFWRRLTRWGALAGMTTGAVVAAVWANLSGGIFDLYELLPGFVANLIVTIVVSLSTDIAPGVKAEFDEAVALVTNFRKGELTTTAKN